MKLLGYCDRVNVWINKLKAIKKAIGFSTGYAYGLLGRSHLGDVWMEDSITGEGLDIIESIFNLRER